MHEVQHTVAFMLCITVKDVATTLRYKVIFVARHTIEMFRPLWVSLSVDVSSY